MRILIYVSNFNWEISFWKPTTKSQTMHTLGVKDKNGSWRITQLWLIGEIFHELLVIINKDYWAIRIQISFETREKLRTGLKTYDILKGA